MSVVKMNARIAGAALWAAVSCLPQSDLDTYSAELSPAAAVDSGSAGVAEAPSATDVGAGGADSSGNAGSDGMVGGGGHQLDGMGGSSGAAMSNAGGGSTLAGAGGGAGDPNVPVDPCRDGVLSVDASRCYIVSSVGAAWQDARDECVALEGALIKVETAEEDAFLDTLLAVSSWVGASDAVVDNVFIWTDGAPVEFGNWGPNQPDRFLGLDCVEKRDTAGRQWFDQPCDNLRAFVCERATH